MWVGTNPSSSRRCDSPHHRSEESMRNVHKQSYWLLAITQQLTQSTAEYFVSPKARHGGLHALTVRENEMVPPTESAMVALTNGGLEPAGGEQN